MIVYPQDSRGIVFNPDVYVLKEDGEPALTRLGRYRKLQTGLVNPPEAIELFIAKCQANAVAIEPDEDISNVLGGITGVATEDAEEDVSLGEPADAPKISIENSARTAKGIDAHGVQKIHENAISQGKRPDFSEGFDFSYFNFSGMDLRGSIFLNCKFNGANFTNANLQGCVFADNSGFAFSQGRQNLVANADLAGAVFIGADLRFCLLPSGSYEGANITEAVIAA